MSAVFKKPGQTQQQLNAETAAVNKSIADKFKAANAPVAKPAVKVPTAAEKAAAALKAQQDAAKAAAVKTPVPPQPILRPQPTPPVAVVKPAVGVSPLATAGRPMRKGGTTKMAKGGSASSRGDGIAQRGKTRGKMV